MVASTKFAHGAWIVCLVIPLLVLGFRAIKSHYDFVGSHLALDMAPLVRPYRNLNLVLVGGMHRGTLEALQYVRSLASDARAIHVEIAGETIPRVQQVWEKWEKEIPLVVLPSPYRNLTAPLIEYINRARKEEGYDVVTVIVPEFVVRRWWEILLHNQTALRLQFLLRSVPGVAVLNMRYKL